MLYHNSSFSLETVPNYKDLGLSSKSQPDYLDEKATSHPIYLQLAFPSAAAAAANLLATAFRQQKETKLLQCLRLSLELPPTAAAILIVNIALWPATIDLH